MKYILIAVLAIALVVGGYLLLNDGSEEAITVDTPSTAAETVKDNPPIDAQPTKPDTAADIQFTGTKLANNYYVYEPEDYAAALNANQPIFLFFYANWCPTCHEQEPMIVSIMNSIKDNPQLKDTVAFRVNYNDNDTDDAEKDLAVEFGVFYQHTMYNLNSEGKITEQFIGQTTEDLLRKAFLGAANT